MRPNKAETAVQGSSFSRSLVIFLTHCDPFMYTRWRRLSPLVLHISGHICDNRDFYLVPLKARKALLSGEFRMLLQTLSALFKPNFMFLRPVTVKKIKIMCYPGRRGKYTSWRGKQSSLASSTCLSCLHAQEEAQKLLKAVRLKWLLLGGETNQYSVQGFTPVCLKTLG